MFFIKWFVSRSRGSGSAAENTRQWSRRRALSVLEWHSMIQQHGDIIANDDVNTAD
jgi:hypothetical protein